MLREERRLRKFEKRVLRRIFGSKRDEATRKRRKLHNEELNDLYCSPNIVRVVKYLGVRGTRLKGNGENYIMRSLMICTAHQILFG